MSRAALRPETDNALPLAGPVSQLDQWETEEVYVQSSSQFCVHHVPPDRDDFQRIECLRASPFSLSSSQVLSSYSSVTAFLASRNHKIVDDVTEKTVVK